MPQPPADEMATSENEPPALQPTALERWRAVVRSMAPAQLRLVVRRARAQAASEIAAQITAEVRQQLAVRGGLAGQTPQHQRLEPGFVHHSSLSGVRVTGA